MRIRISKDQEGHSLVYTRRDGSHGRFNLGADLPKRALARYVVESELHLGQGFYGLLAEGRTVEQLRDPAVIPTLPEEFRTADVITTTLQGLSNGTVAQSEFRATVEAEDVHVPKTLTDARVAHMLKSYVGLLNFCDFEVEKAALELPWR